jgi:thiol-disulfide isomerase/thioredoxin
MFTINYHKMGGPISIIIVMSMLLSNGCWTKKPAAENSTISGQSENKITSTDYSEQSTWVLGYFTRDRIATPPHSEWYVKGYDDYQYDTAAINRLADINKEGLTIKIVLGTWCPDSRREVPRFMRLLDFWNFPEGNITFIGVDNEKLSPVGEYEKLDIQRVPTFIFYKNNIEAGRIIEVPLTSLEQDMVNILSKE